MARGIGDKDSELQSYDGGEYIVGFKEWFPLDNTGLPVLQSQQRFGQEILVARYRTKVEGENDGPPGSIDPLKELPLFVKAFGGDPTTVSALGPTDYDSIPRLLVNLIPQLRVRTKVIVNDSGWISMVEGMNVGPGPKLIRFNGFTTFNDGGKPSWRKGNWGPLCWGELLVVSGDFKGSIVKFLLPYPLEVDEMAGQPCLVRIKGGKRDGEYTKASQRYKNFHETFVGPLSEFPLDKVEDIYNICPETQKIAMERKLVASVQVTESGLADINTLSPLAEGLQLPEDINGPQEAPKPRPQPSVPDMDGLHDELTPDQKAVLDSVEDKLDIARVVLRQAISHEAGASAWAQDSLDDWTMTDAGKAWARQALKPIVMEIGCGSKFAEYTVAHILFILKALGYDDLAKSIEEPGRATDDADF
jgi:hypothetical protein